MADLPYQIDIVVKDLRGMDPPLKPFYEWYTEDQNIQALPGLSNVRINIKERLLWYAQHEDLLYVPFPPAAALSPSFNFRAVTEILTCETCSFRSRPYT